MISTDTEKIEALLTRGVENVYPNSDFLRVLLLKGEQIKIYLGVDPTGPTLHIGHMIPMRKLREFQNLGHKVIFLIGSFTAMIGDPDKTSVRVPLTKEQVQKNMELYLSQASTILDTQNTDLFEVRYNDEWLSKMNFEDVLNLASKMTVQQMLERDMFDKRIKEGKPVYIHEFMYPLMQGYDSIALGVDGEVGGNDQTFNMLTGRTLMKEIQSKEKFVITTKLLVDSSGNKMGKTEGNMITLADTPEDMFGKVMSWTDGMIVSGFELCTDVDAEEIKKIQEKLQDSSVNPKDIKLQLAHTIVETYTNTEKADEAQSVWIQKFEKKEIPDELPEYTLTENLFETVMKHELVPSRSEYRRLLEGNAIHNLTDNTTIEDIAYIPEKGTVIKIGKQKFFKII
jgi:tyrosyl-tRNA synthetase